jgi:methionyl aminopeptidase
MYIEASTTSARRNEHAIKLHGPEGFEGMRAAGRAVAQVLDMLVPEVKPGVTTERIDDLAREFIYDHGWVPACLGYKGYPKVSCISINHVVCHGIPGPRVLKDGDIANIDVTVIVDGWHGDHSRMFGVGEVPRKAMRLMDITWEALQRGIAAAQPGNTIGDIGHAIQTYVEAQRCSVVRDFCGHGLGQVFHDNPNVVHAGRRGEGPLIKPGMFFTIEPMVNAGKFGVSVLSDGWTAVTKDRSLSAQYEHSIGITETGPEVFTLSPAGLHTPHNPALSAAPVLA